MDSKLISALERIGERVPEINVERQYWFLRTYGGEFFNDFYHTESVGIGYNLITLSDFKAASKKKIEPFDYISEQVGELYSEVKQPGRVAGMLVRFTLEVKKGDIIVIPSKSSHLVAFGEVIDDEAYELLGKGNWNDQEGVVTFRKRRKVRWIKRLYRDSLDPKLYGVFFAQQTLSNITDYADYIDRAMYAIYRKGEETHVIMQVTTHGGIDGSDFFGMGNALLSLTESFTKEAGLPAKSDKIDIRTNIQSPGYLEFIGAHLVPMIWLASVGVVALAGGGLRIKTKAFELDLSTSGLIKRSREFLNGSAQRKALEKILEQKMDVMSVEMARDLLSLFGSEVDSDKPQKPTE